MEKGHVYDLQLFPAVSLGVVSNNGAFVAKSSAGHILILSHFRVCLLLSMNAYHHSRTIT